jgi:galactonate dehydratase
MNIDRRTFTKSLLGAAGSLVAGSWVLQNRPAWSRMPVALAQAASRLSPTRVTKIRVFFPPNWDRNGAQALPQSNVVVLVDTEAGITGVGQGGAPDTLRNVSRSVIGKNAFDTEMIWQAAFMDAHYSPGDERLHALGAIDLALWDIKGKALGVPLYQLFGGKAREHIELYATSGLPQGVVPPEEAQRMGLKERAAATMAAGWRVYRVAASCRASVALEPVDRPPPLEQVQAQRALEPAAQAADGAAGGADPCSIHGRAFHRSSRRWSRSARASDPTATS